MPKTQTEYDQMLLDKYVVNGTCWDFTGCTDKDGYGIIQQFGMAHKAHRKMYEMQHGPIPEGFHVHHKCERKICGNPNHLSLTTAADHNITHYVPPTHCPKGHDYTIHGRIRNDTGYIRCAECGREYHRRQKALKGESNA